MTNKKLENEAKKLPQKPGVYLFKDNNGKIVYIGKAKNLKKRVSQYFGKKTFKNSLILSTSTNLEFFITNNEAEALLLEYSLIKKHKPKFNIQLKDDKSYPYLFIDLSERFPGVYFTRKKEEKKEKYFGPYPSAGSVRKVISVIEKHFKLKTCKTDFSKITRPCLKYQINRCSAPCVNLINEKNYAEKVGMALKFLEGKFKTLEKEIEQQMEKASESLEFEKAAELRDTLFAIKRFREKQSVIMEIQDTDFIFYRQSEGKHFVLILFFRGNRMVDKKELVFPEEVFESPQRFLELYSASIKEAVPSIMTNFEIENKEILTETFLKRFGKKISVKNISGKSKYSSLIKMAEKNTEFLIKETAQSEDNLKKVKEYLKLTSIPRIIYGFDISHLGGCFSVASSVCFKDGKPEKSLFRRIKLEEGINDDYRSIYFAVKKRLESDIKRGLPLPNLLIIDGGKGQLNSALKAVKELQIEKNIDLISIAKKEETVFSKNFPEGIKLDFSLPYANLITKVRNESHRFANSYRKTLYKKKNFTSVLLEIPGLGEKTYKKLIKKFKTLKGIEKAGKEEISKITGPKLAEKIVYFLEKIKN